jgi:hypothetical protein
MASSNNQMHDFANIIGIRGNPGFTLIVAFDYYDGPERGLALYPSGEGVRFTAIGDSRSRLFRSFEFTAIEGQWWPQVRALQNAAGGEQSSRVFVPAGSSEMLILLDNNIFHAPSKASYVGVGSPSLEWVSVSSVAEDQLTALRRLSSSSGGFRAVHQIVKNKHRDKG